MPKNRTTPLGKVLSTGLSPLKPFIVFLDFDGVLNSREFFTNRRDPAAEDWSADIDPCAVGYLNELLGENGRVVVSSTWRYTHNQEELEALLREHGFKGKIIGATPDLQNTPGARRGDEIEAWLQSYCQSQSLNSKSLPYVILDDCADFLPHQVQHVFLTDNKVGRTKELCQRAKSFLREEWS